MPYRRLPKTDAARLKALNTLLSNDEIYIARKNFVDWQLLSKAQSAYDKLLTACEQYKVMLKAQVRYAPKAEQMQHNATMYVSHFLQVLFLAVERKEIKPQQLALYGLPSGTTTIPYMKTPEALLSWTPKIIAGERQRIKAGGRPIYNPTIGMVSTHFEIFKEIYEKQRVVIKRTQNTLDSIQAQRPEVDSLLLEIWNQIEKHFEKEPAETRFDECRKLGVVYYYRRNEKEQAE